MSEISGVSTPILGSVMPRASVGWDGALACVVVAVEVAGDATTGEGLDPATVV